MCVDRRQMFLTAGVVLWLSCCGQQPDTTPQVQSTAPSEAAQESEQMSKAEPIHDWPDTVNVSKAGRFYFAGQPSEAGFRKAAADGVTVVVNLRTAGEVAGLPFDESALVGELGMKYVSIPVTPGDFSEATVEQFAQIAASTNQPVLVHCASSNRVGGLWAAYLVSAQGMEWDQALESGRAAGLRSPGMIQATQRVVQSQE